MATQIKLTQKEGIECIQVSSGFRKKVSLDRSSWEKILEWFENDDSQSFECGDIKFKVGDNVLVIEQGHSSVSLNTDEAMALKVTIEKRVNELGTQMTAHTEEIVPEAAQETAPVSRTSARPLNIYSPYMTPVHREVSIMCGKCNLCIDLDSQVSLSGKATICPQCKSILILIDKE